MTDLELFLIGVAVGTGLGIPADWARRRASPMHGIAELANVVGLIATIAIAAAAGSVSSIDTGFSLVAGLVAGEIGADRLAERLWGHAR
jgi:hypothetical protein